MVIRGYGKMTEPNRNQKIDSPKTQAVNLETQKQHNDFKGLLQLGKVLMC